MLDPTIPIKQLQLRDCLWAISPTLQTQCPKSITRIFWSIFLKFSSFGQSQLSHLKKLCRKKWYNVFIDWIETTKKKLQNHILYQVMIIYFLQVKFVMRFFLSRYTFYSWNLKYNELFSLLQRKHSFNEFLLPFLCCKECKSLFCLQGKCILYFLRDLIKLFLKIMSICHFCPGSNCFLTYNYALSIQTDNQKHESIHRLSFKSMRVQFMQS